MAGIERSSDVKEQYGERGVLFLIPGIILLVLGVILLVYQSGWTIGLAAVCTLAGVGLTGFGVFQFTKIRKVAGISVDCPFCGAGNQLTSNPDEDFTCVACHRLVPVLNGVVLAVQQVRCGYCNTLNYYSSKSIGLICESCGRDIPIANDADALSKRRIENLATKEDTALYDVVLTNKGAKQEEMIQFLQHELALNRNQVKEIMDSVPQLLLTGIPRMKADRIAADVRRHGGHADIRETVKRS